MGQIVKKCRHKKRESSSRKKSSSDYLFRNAVQQLSFASGGCVSVCVPTQGGAEVPIVLEECNRKSSKKQSENSKSVRVWVVEEKCAVGCCCGRSAPVIL